MRRTVFVLIGSLALCGCQTAPRDEMSTRESATVHPGDAVVSAVATPFYLVFKSVVCVASVAIAAPVAGIAALSESRFALEARRDLGDGVNQNCGPPYVLSPYRTVPAASAPEVSKGREALQESPLAAAPEPPVVPKPEELPAPAAGG